MRRKVVTLDEVRATAARLVGGGQRSLGPLRVALARRVEGYDLSESDLEVQALRLLAKAGLPAPAQQHPVQVGGRTYRLDLAYPSALLAIELDGWAWHGGRAAFDSDHVRIAALVAAGWRILPYTSVTLGPVLVEQVARALGLQATA